MKTLRTYIDKKDQEITDLKAKLKKSEAEIRMNEDVKKQLQMHKKSNDENINNVSSLKQELYELKLKNERLNNEYQTLNDEIQPHKDLSTNLRSLLKTNEQTDCVLVNGANRYQVHKCILMSRSEEFRRLINESNDLKKSNSAKAPVQTTIEVKDVDSEMMPLFLNYLYTSEVTEDINDNNIDKWVKIADKYKLNGLKKSCLLHRERNMNKNSVVPVLIEAHETDNDRLQQKCFRYMKQENIDLQQSPEWIEYKKQKPKEALELYESYVKEQSLMQDDQNKFKRHNCLSPLTLSRSANYMDNKTKTSTSLGLKRKPPKELIRSSSQDSILNNLNSNASANAPSVYHITQKRVQIEEPLPTARLDHHQLAHYHQESNEPRPKPIINYRPQNTDQHVAKVFQISSMKQNNNLNRYRYN